MDQHPLHDVARKPEKRGTFLLGISSGSSECLHLDEFQVKLMDECCGLPRVIGSLALHPGDGQTAQLWIKEVSQCCRSIPVSPTEGAHEPSYGFRRKRTHADPHIKCKNSSIWFP